MSEVLWSDDELEFHRSVSKRVTNPQAEWKTNDRVRHKHRIFNLVSEDNNKNKYILYQRQNLRDFSDFSCGLSLVQHGGRPVSLIRYNGANHQHGDILYTCHIHRATHKALLEGRKIDWYAHESSEYQNLMGALWCIVRACNVRGMADKNLAQLDIFS